MFNAIRMPFRTTIAAVSALLAVTLVGGLAVLLTSGVSEVRAQPESKGAVHRAKGDSLPVLAKGAACSLLGWPRYEQSCQFDLRQQADEFRTVRIVGVR